MTVLAVATADPPARTDVAPTLGGEAALVLVHGAWHGGWAWQQVAPLLTARGRQVEVVDLPGSDGARGVTLVDQVAALRAVVEGYERVVLVGHSFGAVVARQVAAAAAARVEELILVDGWVVEAGESFLEVMPPAMQARCEQSVVGVGGGRLIPAPPPAAFGVTDEPTQRWLESRLTPQPWATFADPVPLDGAASAVPGRAVVCVPSTLPFASMAHRLGYPVTTIGSGHDVMLLQPAAICDALLGPAGGGSASWSEPPMEER